ncbi:MAG TPA: PQQ-dependent sugar dehydrogenase, partial [Steroidobacteraceae bacterium]|nr:PQQ-dependent sugar dehydrogenase [Steroidobacteraceae bacterium]
AFAADGRMFVWERTGRVWLLDTEPNSEPLIDLSDEVSTVGSLGLTGFALDPQFEQNGYVYLFYTVDPQQLASCDTPVSGPTACRDTYRAGQHATSGVTIGRLVRLQLVRPAGAQDFRTADTVNYASRRVLLGETSGGAAPASGCVVTDGVDGTGGLAFGSDGTLFAGCGDGAGASGEDSGSSPSTQYREALAARLMSPAENVGAFRAQLVDSLSGKILRLDPATGNGVPSNPFYELRSPRSPRSRVWVLGLRDPQHFSVRPGSGSAQQAEGRPGTLYIGETGSSAWEALVVARDGRMNFGWPLYAGVGSDMTDYGNLPAFNLLAPNPLFPKMCAQPFFRFRDLITPDPVHASWPNPCEPSVDVPASDDVFIRERPMIDWLHQGAEARWAALDNAGEPLAMPLGNRAPNGVVVLGSPFGGTSSIGGVWYQGSSFPAPFRNAYYHADSGGEWIKAFAFDAHDNPLGVRDFLGAGGPLGALGNDPRTGDLYYISGLFGSEVHRLSYAPQRRAPATGGAGTATSVDSLPAGTRLSATATAPSAAAATAGTSTTPARAPARKMAASAAATPSSWSNADIGAVNAAGSFTFDGTTFTVKGSGVDVQSSADSFQFVYQTLSGDGSITARVVSQTNTNAWAKAGVMVRETLGAGSTNAFVPLTPTNGIVFQGRALAGGSTATFNYGPIVAAPYWVRLVRAGNTFSASISPDGTTWTALGQTTISMASQTFVGLAVSSHRNGTLCTAVFDNVTVTAAAPPPPDTQAPTTPTGLIATGVTASSVALSWNASTDLPNPGGTGVGGYYVYRNGNTTTPIATVSGTSFTDTGLAATTTYTYQVAAFDKANPVNVSAPSGVLSVTTQNTAPSNWSDSDIGAVNAAGSFTFDGSTFTVKGSGNDVYGSADSFQFVYQSLTGDGSITARVVSQTNTNAWAKAGVMFRETLDPGSRNAFVPITPTSGIVFQGRPSPGGSTTTFNYGPTVAAPYWLRLVRAGSTFTASISADGSSWTALGQTTISMASQVFVGLAVSSHHNGTLSTAVFDNVTAAAAAPPPPDTQAPTIPAGLTATSITASSVSLSWSASTDLPNPGGSGVGGYFVYRNGNTTTPIATVSGTSFTDTGLTANTTYTYQVAAFDRATPVNVSAPSSAFSATTQSTVASGWGGTDVGAVNAPGSFTTSGSTLTVSGSGADVYSTADSFQFVYQVFSGDGSITARVVSQSNTNAWAKAGVMFRETLAQGSANVFVPLTPANGVVFQGRATSGGASSTFTYGPLVAAPYWVRLVRAGSTFSGFASPDGTTWTALGQTTIGMGSQIYVGLAVSSHQNGTLSTAVFDNVLVVGQVGLTVTPRVAGVTLSQSQQFASAVPGGVTWAVDGVGGGNSQVGTISSAGLYTAGSAAGAHSITATSITDPTQSGSARVGVTDLAGVYTYHNDRSRDGANSQEYALNPGDVNTSSFGKLFSCAVDGAIYGQPLWVANLTVNGARHNVVFVTTQHDSLYAFDADAISCVQLWTVSLIDAAHGANAGETTVPSGTTGNLVGTGDGDISPEVGITGTPVIDPTTGILYVVSKSVDSTGTTFYQRLHAIDLPTGNERAGSPATIAGTFPNSTGMVTFSARQENQRPGLALVNGTIYIGWGSHEDSNPWYGWMMAYSYNGSTFTQTAVFNSAPNKGEGGIWMSGGAPAVDSNNNLYVLTGNGTFDANSATAPNNDYGDSLLKLTGNLAVAQYFTPSDQLTLFQGDGDFASGGAAILADLPPGSPVTHLIMGGGKDKSLYVLNRDQLGGLGDANAVQQISFGNSIFTTGAFWNNTYYMAGAGGPLRAYALTPSIPVFSLASSSTNTYGFPGSGPSVSAAGTASGVIWTMDNHSYCTNQSRACGPAVLHAHDAANVASELWNSSMVTTDVAGNAVKFSVPTIANGKVYIGTRGNNTGGVFGSTTVSGELDVYGLKPN